MGFMKTGMENGKVSIWNTGRYTPTTNSKEYPPE